jgi:hypothetical protein
MALTRRGIDAMRSLQFGTSRWRSMGRLTFAMLATLGLTACATPIYGGAERLDVAVVSQSVRGFEFRNPDVLAGPHGMRVHGALCRKLSWAQAPNRLRLDLVGPQGAAVASTTQRLWGLPRTDLRCVFYDIPTGWTAQPGQTLHLTAE